MFGKTREMIEVAEREIRTELLEEELKKGHTNGKYIGHQ